MIYINDWCLNEYVDSVDESLFFHGDSSEIMYEDVTIPGRDGKLHLDLNRYEEITIELNCWIRTDFRNRYRVLLNKLNALKGVTTLRCTPAPEMWGEGYYNTVFKGEISAPTTGSYLHNGSFTLTFNANPRYWLDLGEVSTKYIALEHFFNGARWQAVINDGGTATKPFRVYDLSTTDTTQAFAQLYDIGIASPNPTEWRSYTMEDFTIHTDSLGRPYIDFIQQGYVSEGMGARVNLRWFDEGQSLDYIVTGVNGTTAIKTDLMMDNPTAWEAHPLIVFTVRESSSIGGLGVQINGVAVSVETDVVGTSTSGVLYVDCDLQDCYYIDNDGVKQNANSYVTITKDGAVTTDFPVLEAGENTVHTGITVANPSNADNGYVQIIPRWYLI